MTIAMTLKNNAKATQLIDELLKHYQKPEDILGESGLLKQLTQAVVERALDAGLRARKTKLYTLDELFK